MSPSAERRKIIPTIESLVRGIIATKSGGKPAFPT